MKTRNRRDQLVRASSRARRGTRACPACGDPCGSWRGVGQHLTLDRNDGAGGPVCEGVREEVGWGTPGTRFLSRKNVRHNSRGKKGRPRQAPNLLLAALKARAARAARESAYWDRERRRSLWALRAHGRRLR